MFTTICFRDDFSNFEGFLMKSIGRHIEKKESSSSKRYEMTKLSFGDAISGD